MERAPHHTETRSAWWLFALLLLVPAAGCTSALSAAMYMINGYQVPAEYKGLKGKNVVVVCRPPADDEYRNVRVPERLAAELSKKLGQQVPKIKVIDHRQVARWTDENEWVDASQVGKALKADTVVSIDLDRFSIYEGPTLYQGKASVRVQVLDLNNNGEVVFDKQLPPSVYPPNTGVPTSEREEEQFRREYISVLADEIGYHFYAHDGLDELSRDSDALLR